jgi:type II secretory pathway pseudopilin PulG
VSIAIVGIMLVAALNAVGASKATQRRVADRARATLLAQDLMAEILQQDYEEPGGSASLAADSGEDGGNRSDFDDVDDYHGWSSEPPQSADGTDYADLDGWQRQVEVLWVDPADFSQVKVSESGVKLITVTVSFRGAFVVSLSAVRTASAKYDME